METVIATCVLKKRWGRGYKRIACDIVVDDEFDMILFINKENGESVEWLDNGIVIDADYIAFAYEYKNVMFRKGWSIDEIVLTDSEPADSEPADSEPADSEPSTVSVTVEANNNRNTIYKIVAGGLVYKYVWVKWANLFYLEVRKKGEYMKHHDFKNRGAWSKSLNKRIAGRGVG